MAAADAAAAIETDASLDAFEREVRDGLPSQAARWIEAARQRAYYELRGADLIRPRPAEAPADFAARPKLTSKLTRRVIRELGKGLYAPGPTRTLPRGPAADLYDQVLTQSHANALMQHADRLAWLQGVFAVQVAPTGRPERPVRLDPWRADEFAVFLDDDDPRTPRAVCVRSVFEARRQVRYQLWSATAVRTYWSEVGDVAPLGRFGRALTFDPARSGPHGLGCLPFVFVWNEPPVCEFWVEGLGRALADTDAVLDVTLSDLAQALQTHAIPREYAENVSNLLSPVHRPGGLVQLVPRDHESQSRVFFNQPDLAVAETWQHVANYANQTLLDLDLPLSAQPEHAWPESGVAIVARRMPLIDTWRARQKPFEAFEDALKTTVLTVAGHYLHRPELLAAAAVPLVVTFPEPALPLPTPDRDQADATELEWGTKSRLMLVQERHGLTREQALDHLRQVAADRAEEARLIAPEPATDSATDTASDTDSDTDTDTDTEPPLGD